MPSLWQEATESEWRARAEAWVPAIRNQQPSVTSADKAYEWMRNNDYYVPRRYVRDVWREVKEQEDQIPILNRMDDDAIIPRSMHRTTWSNIRRNNRYIVEITGTYRGTGDPARRTVALDADHNLTVGEIYEQGMGFAEDYAIALAGPDFSLRISHALHRSGRGWE